jgi:hypothetical protein
MPTCGAAGFHTHTTPASAEVYAKRTLHHCVHGGRNLQGQVVPRGVIGHGIDAQNDGHENYPSQD